MEEETDEEEKETDPKVSRLFARYYSLAAENYGLIQKDWHLKYAQSASEPPRPLDLEEGGSSQFTNMQNNPTFVAKPSAPQMDGYGSNGVPKGPTASDMIHANRDLEASCGSGADVSMSNVESVLGKRGAEEQEVQGKQLDLTLTIMQAGLYVELKRDRKISTSHGGEKKKEGQMGGTGGIVKKKGATGLGATGRLARPNVWSRQPQ